MYELMSNAARRLARGRYLPVLLAVLLLPLPALYAAEADSLYTAQVRLDPQDPEGRAAAYRDALQQILVQITGSEEAALAPQLNELFPDPARYVLQLRPGEDNSLWVSMDGAAIETIVRQTGYPVWGSDRPMTMVWLAVDWGQGDRGVVTEPRASSGPQSPLQMERNRRLLERVRDVARQRGLPVVFPELDAEGFEDIGFTDVWGGFHDRLLAVSRQHGADGMLVGRLRPQVQERNRWSFYFGDQQRQWNGEPEEAVHRLADTLAGQLAIAGNSRLETIALTVTGIESVQAYGEVQRLLAGLQPIENVAIEHVAGGRIHYSVEINGGIGRLRSALEIGGGLRRAAAPPLSAGVGRNDAALHYAYDP